MNATPRISADKFRAMAKKPKPNKYGAIRTTFNGVTYDSKGEAGLAQKFELERLAGEIDEVKRQVKIPLDVLTYNVDFVLIMPDGSIRYAEFKGKETQRFRDIRKMWKKYGPGDLEIWKGNPPRLAETLKVKE